LTICSLGLSTPRGPRGGSVEGQIALPRAPHGEHAAGMYAPRWRIRPDIMP
jgi:hypothetical protein